MIAWLSFFVAAAMVIVAGRALVGWADIIAHQTKLGRLWTGAILLAIVTSLPELVTDVVAVRIDEPDLAAGDLFGSNMANMGILAIVVLAFPTFHGRVGALVGHAMLAGTAITMTGLAIIFVIAKNDFALGPIGLGPPLIAIVYLLAAWKVHHPNVLREFSAVLDEDEGSLIEESKISLRGAVWRFAAAATVIAAAGSLLAISADRVVENIGVRESFFGVVGLAAVTSLPELTMALTAVRRGAADLAVSNLFGSNAVNMALLLALELAYTRGSFLSAIDDSLATVGAASIVLTALGPVLVMLQLRRHHGEARALGAGMLAFYVLALSLAY